MELKHYYCLVFSNQREFFIETDIETTVKFTQELDRTLMLNKKDYIVIYRNDIEPIWIRSNQLFSVQKIFSGIIGAQTKLWRLS